MCIIIIAKLTTYHLHFNLFFWIISERLTGCFGEATGGGGGGGGAPNGPGGGAPPGAGGGRPALLGYIKLCCVRQCKYI